MERFWMVLGRGVPTMRHTTRLDAKNEAERLARIHRGTEFIFLEAIAKAISSDVQWEKATGDHQDSIPF